MIRADHAADSEARWMHAAARAPSMAAGRLMLRAALLLLAVPGAMHLWRLVRWSWNTAQSGLLVLIVVHIAAIALAVGLPAQRRSLTDDAAAFLGALRSRYSDRAGRLGALARAITLEAIVFFLLPPLMTVVFGDSLRWPAQFVVAVAACTVVWPLERIATAQRREARRLSDRRP